jgi:hypothetical protein
MNKKIFFVFILLVSTIIFSGCGVKKENNFIMNEGKNNFGNGQNRGTGQGMFTSSTWQNVGEKGNIEDLKLGEKIMIMGATNQDGSINANRIMIGEMPKIERPSTTLEQIREKQEEEGNFGERNHFIRDDNTPGDARQGMVMGGGFLQGEILKMDENSLILKTETTGTKIVYFTPETEIYIFSPSTIKENTNTTSVK